MTTLTILKERSLDGATRKDLKTLGRFIEIYCHGRHADLSKQPVVIPNFTELTGLAGIEDIVGKTPVLCPECRKLLMHAFIKRLACPWEKKPMCKHCPRHCYAPAYRQQIREVMKYTGRKLVLGGRVDYLYHLLF